MFYTRASFLLVLVVLFCFCASMLLARSIRIQDRYQQRKLKDATSTGVRVLLQKKGLNYVFTKLTPYIITQLEALSVPDVKGSTSVKIIGQVDYAITNITINNVKINGINIDTQSPNSITFSGTGISMNLHLDWSYSSKIGKGNGDADASANNVGFSVPITLTRQNNKPYLTAQSATVDLGDLNIQIHGGGIAGWLINLLQGLFEGAVKDAASKAIQNAILQTINTQINEDIQNVNFLFPIKGTDLEIDAQLSEDPAVTSDFISMSVKAEMYDSKQTQEPPFQPVPLPTTMEQDTMINIFATDFVANAAFYSAFLDNALQFTLKPEMVPAASPIQLNTTSLKYTLPFLYNKFPNQLVQIVFQASAAPSVKTVERGSSLLVNGTALFQAINSDQSVSDAFSLTVGAFPVVYNVSVAQVGTGTGLNFTGVIDSFNTYIALKQSFIGDIDVSKFIDLLNILAKSYVRVANVLLAKGVEVQLPKGLLMTNPSVTLHYGYATVAADVEYNPSQLAAVEKQYLLKMIRFHEQSAARMKKRLFEKILHEEL